MTDQSFEQKEARDGVRRRPIDAHLDGSSVFTFSITKPVVMVKEFMERYALCDDDIDYFIFHQANKIINTTIARRLKIHLDKVPMTLEDLGNTGGAGIPLTLCSVLQKAPVKKRPAKFLLCGFGSGLCWGVASLEVPPEVRASFRVCSL